MSIRFCLFFLILVFNHLMLAQNSSFDALDFSGQWFVGYKVDDAGTFHETNAFLMKRGYVTVQKNLNRYLSARVTQDIAVDREGDGEGDIEIRLKYGYLQYMSEMDGFLSRPFIAFGVVHRPWLAFEQKINHYRVQGTMFLERIGMLRSADYGFIIGAMIGGEVDATYQKEVNSSYPGKYGSFSIGLYNGGGYDAVENNNNKLIESRMSLRPFSHRLPGFQINWITALGKGNTIEAPDYYLNALCLSMDSRYFTVNTIYYKGKGNLQGTQLTETGRSYAHDGYSVFSEACIPGLGLRPIVRYDQSNLAAQVTEKRIIFGIAYYFYKNSKIVFDWDIFKRSGQVSEENKVCELVVEFRY